MGNGHQNARRSCGRWKWAAALLVVCFGLNALDSRPLLADRIVLRSLQIISGRTVVSFDEDAVRLDDGSTIRWDQIERASIEGNKEQQFQRLLKELGEPLYRIRQRLQVGDYAGLVKYAEAIYPRYVNRRSPTAYMVAQALMWGRLAIGRREAAVEPYMRAYEYLRATGSRGDELPGTRRLRFDPATALSPSLVPVWFDADEARRALPGVFQAVRAMAQPRPEGVYIYYASLAAAAGDPATAENFLRPVRGDQRLVAEWRDIVRAQIEVLSGQPGPAISRLQATQQRMLPETRPAALYWLGIYQLKQTDRRQREEGVLQLLHLPALFGKSDPELAAAGLYQSMQALEELGDIKGSIALRKELLVRYAHTVHAEKARAESQMR